MVLWWLLLSISLCWAGCPTDTTCEKAMNRCYKFVDEYEDFFSAEETCLELGGHLVSFRNAFEKTLVQDAAESMFLGGTDYWIGANHIEADTWTWTDGSKWSYTNWFPGEPKSLETVGATVGSGLWSSASQDSRKPFVCGLPLTSQTVSVPSTCPICPTTPTPVPRQPFCEDGWVHFGATKSCYKIILKQTWTAADSLCQTLGGHLASIHSEAENEFIADFAAGGNAHGWTDQAWIGLYQASGFWRWSDSTPIDYVSWAARAPDNVGGSEFCVEIAADNMGGNAAEYYKKWNDYTCSIVLRAGVCKKQRM